MRRRLLVMIPFVALGYAGCSSSSSPTASFDPYAIGRGSYLLSAVIDCDGCAHCCAMRKKRASKAAYGSLSPTLKTVSKYWSECKIKRSPHQTG